MSEPVHFPAAKERFPQHFEITDKVITRLEEWIDRSEIAPPTTALGFVKFLALVRAANLYRSINLLLSTDHWEDAAILSRSLFELLLNIDEVVREPQTAETKARTYLRFSKLQEYLEVRSQTEYNVQTNRSTKEQEAALRKLEKMSQSLFREFRCKKGTGWVTSWCHKKVAELARDASNPRRKSEYRIIYALYSELAHSSPYAAMTTFAELQEGQSFEELLRRQEKSEEGHLLLVLGLSTVWLIELLFHVKSLIPSFDARWSLEVMQMLYKSYGVEPPPFPRTPPAHGAPFLTR